MKIEVKDKAAQKERIITETREEPKEVKMEWKSRISKYFNSILFIILLGVLLFAKTMFFYQNTIAVAEPIGIETILGTLFFLIIVVSAICILPNRARIVTGFMVSFFISLLLFLDNIYYTFSNNFLSVAQITNLQYGDEIASTLPMLLEWKQIWYFADIIILLILIATKVLKIEKKPKKTLKQRGVKIGAGMIGVICCCILMIQYVEKGNQLSYNKDMQIRETTIYGYHIYDIQNAINIKASTAYKTKEQMEEAYQTLKQQYDSKYYPIPDGLEGILVGKNVIVLQLESVQEFVLHQEINGKEITPNLNRFLEDNVEFSNMFMQSYSTTADSEHSTITSLYPMENGMAFSKYYTNQYDDLFKMFHENGYYTSYMHGNYPYFWNRGNVYGRMEVDELDLKEQFEDLSENINGDLSDELLYRQAVQKLKTQNQPFISYIVSASSHTPYILEGLQDRSKITIDVGEYKDTYFGNYLEAVNYADYAFGVFLEELKKEELYDDTAILVFGDHNGLSMYQEEMMNFLKQKNPNLDDIDLKLNYIRVACGFKIPGIEKQKIEKTVSKLDIKPTLTYLAGIEDRIFIRYEYVWNKRIYLFKQRKDCDRTILL